MAHELVRRNPETGQFESVEDGGHPEGVLEFDESDVHHQHIRTNVKNTADGSDHQTWFDGPAISHDPLDGNLSAGDVAMLVGVTDHGTDINIANPSSMQVSASVHVTREVSLDSEPHFATREYENDETISSTAQDAGDTGELADLNWQWDNDLAGLVLLVDRLNSHSGFNDSTNGAAAGLHNSANPQSTYMNLLERFGGPVIVGPDDELNEFYLENTGNEGGNLAWSTRVQMSLHWLVFEGEKPDFPEVYQRF